MLSDLRTELYTVGNPIVVIKYLLRRTADVFTFCEVILATSFNLGFNVVEVGRDNF